MHIDLEDNDIYASDRPTGAIVSGGSFGENSLASTAASPTAVTLEYLSRVNPNLLALGGLVLGGIFIFKLLVSGLGQANPNNQLLEVRKIEAQTNQQTLAATTDALKTVANQRPSCISLICIMPEEKPQAQPAPQEPQEVQPPYPIQPYPQPEYPEYYEVQAAAAIPIGNARSPKSPDFWHFQWQQNPNYVRQWQSDCHRQNWNSPECQALFHAMNN